LAPLKAASLNLSDKKNPRRLIRAIEISLLKSKVKTQSPELESSVLFVGLAAPKDELSKRIERRVKERLRAGIEKEIKSLLSSGVKWQNQAMYSLGYRQWRNAFEGKETKDEATKSWIEAEKKYAKRQFTWFKKEKRINWLDITFPSFEKSVEKLVRKWYSNGDVSKN
jgi:tRNA dimethylallyltransferase